MTASRLPLLGFIISVQLLACVGSLGATHTLTINTNGNGTVGRNPTNSVYPNGSVVTLTALPASGWSFSSWSGDASGTNNPLNVTMDANKVITANFSPIPSYTLTVNIFGNGSVNPFGGTFLSNTVVSLTATPSNGWIFHQWAGDASGSANPLGVTMSANKIIDAVFVQPPSISSQPGGGSVNVGSSFSFSVSATGSAPIAYQWLFNGVALSNATAATLGLTNVELGNGGNYQVVVSNPYGNATSTVAALIVNCSGTNVVSVASDPALRAAIAIGGNVRLCFSGTVTLTNTIDVPKDTTLDASDVSVVISGNNAVRLFNVSAGVQFNLTNLSLVNGQLSAPGAGVVPGGAALLNQGGTVRLVSCLLSNHSVVALSGDTVPGEIFGAAICNLAGSLEIYNSLLISNSASGAARGTNRGARGGAIYSSAGALHITNSTFIGNRAFTPLGPVIGLSAGGAIYADGAVSILKSLLADNTAATASDIAGSQTPATVAGGALFLQSGTAVIDHARLFRNSAAGGNARLSTPSPALGGAVYNAGAMDIRRCSIATNTATAGGGADAAAAKGGAIHNVGALTVLATTIASNQAVSGYGRNTSPTLGFGGADGFGGGVFNTGTLTITNCTVVSNLVIGGIAGGVLAHAGSAYGGGLFNTNGTVAVANCSIALNVTQPALDRGGGGALGLGANLSSTNGEVSLRNSLLAYPGLHANAWGTMNDGGYNMCSDGSANFSGGSSFNFTNPRLAPLANNGGPTLTMALRTDSPAVDFGTASGAPATDQRGVVRPHGAGVDIGAFEVGPLFLPLSGQRSGSVLNLSFDGAAGLSYRIERSTDLLTWELQEATGILATNGIALRTIPMAGPRQFFRLSLDF